MDVVDDNQVGLNQLNSPLFGKHPGTAAHVPGVQEGLLKISAKTFMSEKANWHYNATTVHTAHTVWLRYCKEHMNEAKLKQIQVNSEQEQLTYPPKRFGCNQGLTDDYFIEVEGICVTSAANLNSLLVQNASILFPTSSSFVHPSIIAPLTQ